jgi:hypothetical protein
MILSSLLLTLLPGTTDLPRALELLRAGRDAEALTLLESLDSSPETKLWTLRARAGAGQVTEILEAADSGELTGADADYLRGIAFHRQALNAIAEGKGGMVEFQFQDAAAVLAGAVQIDPVRYADAFLPLTEAYWNTQKLDEARAAGEQAAERLSKNPRAHHLLGEVCFSQFVTAKADEAQAELAAQHSEAAAEAFRGALKACDGDLAGHSSMGAKAASKLGDLAVWNEAKERAASEYALAISWDPTQVDYAQIMNSIGNEGLISCLKEGCQGFEARYGDRNPAEATPLWWLGFVQFNEKQYADADLTFERVLGLYPAFTNSWWYRAEARFHQSDIDGFLECVRGLGAYGMEALAAQVNTDYTRNITVLGGAIKKLNDSGRFLDAAYLCDIRTAANPKSWEFFDNAALFYREAACKLMGGPRRVMWKKDAAKLETAHSYFERSVAAYATAYEIDPTKPHLLNDKAVVLDYYFNRELDEAQRLYKRAVEQADALLEDSDSLGEFERSLAELAKRDGANNLKLLQRRLEREEKKRERDEKKKKKGEDG